MADIVWPGHIAPYRCLYYLQPYTGGTESPLTRTRKVYGLGRDRWVMRMSLRGGYDGTPDDAEGGWGPELDATIAELKGGQNRVALWDFRRPRPVRSYLLGTAGGLTIAAGAAPGADTLRIAGFAPYAFALSRGDYIGGDGRAHLVRSATPADAAGVATVTFMPPLEVGLAAGTAATVERASSWFHLVSDDAGQNETEVGQLTTYQLELTEDLA